MPSGGWIPFWRKAFDNRFAPRKQRRPYTEFEAWLDLLCRAVQDPDGDTVISNKYQTIRLEPGQILVSQRTLQAAWRWGSNHKVRRFMDALCRLEMLEITSTKPSILTIVTAKEYGLVRPTKRPGTVPRPSHDRPTTVPVQQEEQDKQDKQTTTPPTPPGGKAKIEAGNGLLKPEEFIAEFNAAAAKAGWQKCEGLTAGRTKSFRARRAETAWRKRWREALAKAVTLPALAGANDRAWTANVDWFLRPETLVKILEGRYDAWIPTPAKDGSSDWLRELGGAKEG